MCLVLIFGIFSGCEKAPSATAPAHTASPPRPSSPPPVPPAVDPVAAAMPAILKQIQSLDFPAAYVALTALDKKSPGHPEVQKLLAELRVVLAEITPRTSSTKTAANRQPQRLADLPAFEQTQFLLFVKQAHAKRDLPVLFKEAKSFCVKHPDVAGAWLLQAQLALTLQRPLEGTFAAENLVALGALDSKDHNVIATLAALESAGWLKPRP